jgi:hypothetical protein
MRNADITVRKPQTYNMRKLNTDGNNIKMDLVEVGCESVDWICMARDNRCGIL